MVDNNDTEPPCQFISEEDTSREGKLNHEGQWREMNGIGSGNACAMEFLAMINYDWKLMKKRLMVIEG